MAKKYYAIVGENFADYVDTDHDRKLVLGLLDQYSTNGKSNAIDKGFNDEDKRDAFLAQPELLNFFQEFDDTTGLYAYIDGSFTEGATASGSGIVLLDDGELKALFSISNPAHLGARQVTGELDAAIIAIKWALQNGYSSINLVHDYRGTVASPFGWGKKSPVSIAYVEELKKLRKQLTVNFHNVGGHTQVKYNEWADQLARNAVQGATVKPDPTLTEAVPTTPAWITSLPDGIDTL